MGQTGVRAMAESGLTRRSCAVWKNELAAGSACHRHQGEGALGPDWAGGVVCPGEERKKGKGRKRNRRKRKEF